MNKESELCAAIKKYREAAGLTIEQAADELYISWRALSYYESGERYLTDVTAANMAKLYNAPIIEYLWLKNTKCGRNIPNIENRNLMENILSLAINIRSSDECLQKLMTIGLDGQITAKEKPEYIQIVDTFRLLAKDIAALKFLDLCSKE